MTERDTEHRGDTKTEVRQHSGDTSTDDSIEGQTTYHKAYEAVDDKTTGTPRQMIDNTDDAGNRRTPGKTLEGTEGHLDR